MFTARNAIDSPGKAGRPLMSAPTAIVSVTPNESASASQVQNTRSPKRSAAARKSAKKSRSGGPSRAASFSPGIGSAKETDVNTCGWFETMFDVGPRQTEYASIHGIRQATKTTSPTVSNRRMNQKPSSVAAASLAKLATASSPASSSPQVTRTSASPTGRAHRHVRSGSARYTNENTAGTRTSEIQATSHQVEAFQSELDHA